MDQSDGGTDNLIPEYTGCYKKLDYGIMAGLGYNFHRFGMEATAVFGLANIVKSGSANHGSPNSFKNEVATIGLFYNFGD